MSDNQSDDLTLARRLVEEKALRRLESLRLYEPLAEQQRFHLSLANERLVRGSNRSGKSLSSAVEIARAVLGKDPLKRYPRAGICYAVGMTYKHAGQVMWRMLGRAGAFKMIFDTAIGRWRAYRPWEPADRFHVSQGGEILPAPPLIPDRLISEIAWEDKKEMLPRIVRLHSGWEIHFFSSQGTPPNGSKIDLSWFDEEIENSMWYPEVAARLVDNRGRFIWSATPQAGTDQLLEIHERAEREAQSGTATPTVTEHHMTLAENPHIDESAKSALAAKLSEEQRKVRIDGDYAVMGWRVYPEVSRKLHGAAPDAIPSHWTRYACVDPGRQVCAVLFAAVTPPEEGDHIVFYDELYLETCTADMFAAKMREKCQGQTIQEFIIDHQGGRIAQMGSGQTVEDHYSASLKKYGVRSLATGYRFIWGSSDRKSGVEAFRTWLLIRPCGTPRLKIMFEKLPNFFQEISRYRYKKKKTVQGDIITDDPDDSGRAHLMACCRYLALRPITYVQRSQRMTASSGAVVAFRRRMDARKKSSGALPGIIRLGPAGDNPTFSGV